MLETLRVRNLAIVENVRVDFEPGLNVVTGETGAGKSIIIGALGLLLGERAGKTLIRAGEDKCGVEAVFSLADPSGVDAVLDELGMDACEDGQLVIRRIISATGSNSVLVNDAPATVQALKRIGNLLVDMHGAHDHQSLLSQDFQLDLLDSFGHLWAARDAYEKLYGEMTALEAQRRELDDDDQDVAQQIDMLSFQVKEIDDAGLEDEDEEELAKEHARVANAQRILELADGLRLSLADDETSAFNGMAAAQNMLGDLAAILDDAEEWKTEAQSIAIQIQELANAIGAMAHDIDADPGRLQWIDDRMALLHSLKRKYGDTTQEILDFLQKARQRLDALENRGERIRLVEEELAKATKRAQAAGKKLHGQREKAAKQLAEAITGQLRDLAFPHGVFEAELSLCEPRPSGMDTIEFGFAPNAGEPMRPLRAIASGGEMSRVMLATKAVLADHDRIPVLVFDEIDSNVGGEMGNAIGEKLTAVASSHQVLCITHLPQVAVHGVSHYRVEKHVQDGRTKTQIVPIEEGERVDEVARMLGGKDITSVATRHAKEMLARKNG